MPTLNCQCCGTEWPGSDRPESAIFGVPDQTRMVVDESGSVWEFGYDANGDLNHILKCPLCALMETGEIADS